MPQKEETFNSLSARVNENSLGPDQALRLSQNKLGPRSGQTITSDLT